MASKFQISPGVSVVPAKATDRVGRYPKHTFNVRSQPFSVQPIGIAPVLPGETLGSMFMESRVITDPIANPITGWKKDYFFFYVKATALYGDAIRNMFVDLDDNTQPVATIAANDVAYYTAKGGIAFLELGLKNIVDSYFRDEDTFWNTPPLINGYPAAQIRENTWMDSMVDKDVVPDQAALDAAADTGDLERLMTAYEQLRALGLAAITYEEYLATFGINIDVEKDERPELVFHTSDFQYPSNAVNPADGSVASAVSWVFRQGETKKRKFFKEPGFIIGLTITRPKVFFAGLAGNLAAHLSRAWDWMPELLNFAPVSSLKKFDADTGPLGDRTTLTDAYFVDMRDLFTAGDQFQNRIGFDPELDALSMGTINMLALPDTGLNWRYPTAAMVSSLYVGVNQFIREDGYFSLNIKGKQRDFTPGTTLIG
jgi:hypothetical protein